MGRFPCGAAVMTISILNLPRRNALELLFVETNKYKYSWSKWAMGNLICANLQDKHAIITLLEWLGYKGDEMRSTGVDPVIDICANAFSISLSTLSLPFASPVALARALCCQNCDNVVILLLLHPPHQLLLLLSAHDKWLRFTLIIIIFFLLEKSGECVRNANKKWISIDPLQAVSIGR